MLSSPIRMKLRDAMNCNSAITAILFVSFAFFNARAEQVEVFAPAEPPVIDGEFTPVRLELKESYGPPGAEELQAFVYYSIERAHSWDEPMYQVLWNALTWNGTGVDLVLADADTLRMRARITPADIPFGFYLESLYYDGVARRVFAHPDREAYSIMPEEQTTPALLETPEGGAYTFILWPFLLARLDWGAGSSVILPDHSTYSMRNTFFRVDYVGENAFEDLSGSAHQGFMLRGQSFRTAEDAKAQTDGSQRVYFFHLTPEPPYVIAFGHESVDPAQDASDRKVWRLTDYQLLSPSPADRFDEIFQERQRRLKEEPQELPWKLPK